MKFFIWPINSGVLTSLLFPHLSSSFTDSLPSLNLLCHSKTHARFMQDASKALLKSGQWHFHQDNTLVHYSILVTNYLTKMGIKTVPQPPYSQDLAPCDFCLFSKLRGCRYERIEDFHGAFQKLLERYNKCIAAGGDYFEEDQSFMCVLSIKVLTRKKSGKLSYAPRMTTIVNTILSERLIFTAL